MIGSQQSGAEMHTQPMNEINTTPLVDVMLVLLVIFIITAPLLTHAVKIELPKASTQPLVEKPEVIHLALDANGQYFWNDIAIANDALKGKLDVASRAVPQPELQIRADKNTRYQALAGVMAIAQNAGINKLGFLSEPQ